MFFENTRSLDWLKGVYIKRLSVHTLHYFFLQIRLYGIMYIGSKCWVPWLCLHSLMEEMEEREKIDFQKKRLLWFEPTFRMSFISVMVKLVLIYWLRRNYCEDVVHGINKVNTIYHWVTCVWNYLIYCKINKTACQWVIVQKLRLYKNQNDEISTIFKTNKDIA